jgi:hypothetical protein
MELIIFKAADAHPEPRRFDGPVSVLLASTIAGRAEEVPGFNTISDHGIVRRCIAYCDMDAKRNGLPINSSATAFWHISLKRHGYERGLRRADGSIADWLAGNVVVLLDERECHPAARSHSLATH